VITFAREMLCECVQEAQPLLDEHYRELAKNQDRVKLEPCWQRYAELEAQGAFIVFTAREDGRLIGYSAFASSPHPHYAGLRLVSNDVLFLDKAHRVGRTGIRLIKFCEEQIEATYVKDFCITWHAKEHTPLAGMLQRMGYGIQDIVLSRLY